MRKCNAAQAQGLKFAKTRKQLISAQHLGRPKKSKAFKDIHLLPSCALLALLAICDYNKEGAANICSRTYKYNARRCAIKHLSICTRENKFLVADDMHTRDSLGATRFALCTPFLPLAADTPACASSPSVRIMPLGIARFI